MIALPHAVREVLRSPEVTCDVAVSVRRQGSHRGWLQLHSGQALRGDTVAAVSSAGGRVEVAWWGVDDWHTQLTRAATVPVPDAAEPPPPPEVEVPLDVLLATGEAIRTHRTEVLDELVPAGRVRRPGTGARPGWSVFTPPWWGGCSPRWPLVTAMLGGWGG